MWFVFRCTPHMYRNTCSKAVIPCPTVSSQPKNLNGNHFPYKIIFLFQRSLDKQVGIHLWYYEHSLIIWSYGSFVDISGRWIFSWKTFLKKNCTWQSDCITCFPAANTYVSGYWLHTFHGFLYQLKSVLYLLETRKLSRNRTNSASLFANSVLPPV